MNRLRRTKSQMDEACLKAEGAVDESVLPSEEDVQRLTKQETRAFRGRRQFPPKSVDAAHFRANLVRPPSVHGSKGARPPTARRRSRARLQRAEEPPRRRPEDDGDGRLVS